MKCAAALAMPNFRNLYESLPSQLIHGDIHPLNIIFSQGKPFFIDLEAVRMDVRLRDFAVFCGKFFLEEYLTLIENNQLFPFLQNHYGQLEENEQESFPLIVLLERCCALSWLLQMLEQAISVQENQAIQTYHTLVLSAIKHIDEMATRIPALQKIVE